MLETAPEEDEGFVGVVTRATSWVLDAVAINVVAIGTGLGAELVLSIFPVSPHFASVLKPIAGAIYVVWIAAYFVMFWSWTGQTLGARAMQIRVQTTSGGRVKPVRAFVRWVGMNLAMVPLFAGFAPILFRRRGFPDWLARTVVIRIPPLSVAEARPTGIRSAGAASRRLAPASSARSDIRSSDVRDGRDPPRPGGSAGGSSEEQQGTPV
jgi:uncharacterized RDD family membrane protein YckC